MKKLIYSAACFLSLSVFNTATIQADDRAPDNSDRQVGNVTSGEVNDLNTRRTSEKFWSFGMGPTFLSDSTAYSASLQHYWDVHENADISLGVEGGISSIQSVGIAEIGSRFLFSPGDVTPYLGGGFGGGFVNNRDRDRNINFTDGGFVLTALGGLRFFRTSDTSLDLAAKYHTIYPDRKTAFNFWAATLSILF
jgi:hypothetical protein